MWFFPAAVAAFLAAELAHYVRSHSPRGETRQPASGHIS